MPNSFSWLCNLWRRFTSDEPRRFTHRTSPRFRPRYEMLEDRRTPAIGFSSAISLGGTSSEAIAVDGAGATYLTGHFNNDLAKYNADGSLASARSFGSPGTQQAVDTVSIAVDATGNIYVCGNFVGEADFGGTTLVSQGYRDGFAAKLDANGEMLWVHRLGGAYDGDYANDIAVDGAGNVFVTGAVQATAAVSFGDRDIFVTKLDAGGQQVWSNQFGAPSKAGWYGSEERGSSIAVDNAGNVLVSGTFKGSVDFDPGSKTFNLSSGGTKNAPANAAFVLKLNNAGGFVWADAFQGSSSAQSHGHALAVDANNNVFVTGTFAGAVDFDPGKAKATLPNAGEWDVFVVKLDPAGKLAWGRSMGGAGTENWVDTAGGIAVDSAGDVYVTGSFMGTATFGSTTLTSAGEEDVFVTKLSGSGDILWAASLGGPGLDRGFDIAVDEDGDIFIAGICAYGVSDSDAWADLDPGAGEFLLGRGGFLLKLHQ